MYFRRDVSAGTANAYGISAVFFNSYQSSKKELIALTCFDRSKTQLKALSTQVSTGTILNVGSQRVNTKGERYYACFKPVRFERDRFFVSTIINKEAQNGKYLVVDGTNQEEAYEDIYNYLMCHYKLPLLREWIPQLIRQLENGDVILDRGQRYGSRYESYLARDMENVMGITLHGRNVPVKNIHVYDFEGLNDASLKDTVSMLLREGVIKVSDVQSRPLEFSGLDDYITNYGKTLVRNLDRQIQPLTELSGEVEGFAAKHKRLYPQQAACINGIMALKKAGSQYGLMIEGMGCGKTLQGAATVDAYFNQKWLKEHPGKSLKDLYLSPEQPKYRNVLMAPSHLVAKWKEEIMSEIPGATVTIIDDFDKLPEIRAKGKARTGREWYLISKDFAKLGSQLSPIPTHVVKMVPKLAVCSDCLHDEENRAIEYKQPGQTTCKRCGGRRFEFVQAPEFGEKTALQCPSCGNLLMRPSQKARDKAGTEKADKLFLTPADFASHSVANDTCSLCGAHLWGVDCKPIGTSQEDIAKKQKWYKISHYKNFQKKGRDTAFVLKGHEDEYLFDKVKDDVKKSPVQFGPRKFAPSIYIKKYLKGYFDFCVLDEAHKYENGGTAQSIAAHALMKVSGFTLCLTGTITNGKADSLFYLLYMLDPRRMNKRGYKYSDVMDFSRKYGSIETVYELKGGAYDDDEKFKSSSRGRVLVPPRVKPGISPLLFTDFLLDKAVFLDLADLSNYLPALKEQVVLCDMPEDSAAGYGRTIEILKEQSREKGGRAILSTMLQFGLAYPDKPYGFNPIMHPLYEDTLICNVPSCDNYRDDELLPKEEKLVELVRSEIAQDRNVFVYCAYTGSEEMNVTGRLKAIVEKHCNLSGQVLVMQASSPQATKREEFIKKKASEGIRVFICNMKLVETGLDFCFKYDGTDYNYPTIIFYQLTYELAVMWQASRRHYRLNQREECHTYYLAYANTLQHAAVQIMAEKQVAASAIQGKFSADGLAAMAKGVDPRLKLAQMLADGDNGMDRESLENMFDVMNSASNDTDDDRFSSYVPPKTFYEIMGGAKAVFDQPSEPLTASVLDFTLPALPVVEDKESVPEETEAQEKRAEESQASQGFDLFAFCGFSPFVQACAPVKQEEASAPKKAAARKKKEIAGQLSLFDDLVA